jgi:CRP-like cAMP-binding protein
MSVQASQFGAMPFGYRHVEGAYGWRHLCAPAGQARRHAVHEHPLIRKLESQGLRLTGEEEADLLGMPMQVESIRADQDIVREGDRPTSSCMILQGYAAMYKVTPTGKRQIVAFHLAGDIPDLQSTQLEVLDTSLGTLTPAKVAFIRHDVINEVCERHFRIARALWRHTLIDAAIFREWVVNVGRREALHALAHVMCEFVVRMRSVGLADDHECELPMTQSELGDALGISTVHVNRTLQELRASGLIRLTGARLTVLDWDGLRDVGEFDPTYLQLNSQAAA